MKIEKEDIRMVFNDEYYIVGLCRISGKDRPCEVVLGVKNRDLFNKYLMQNGGEAPEMPDSVEAISDFAFQNFGMMKTISLPSKLERIGEGAFRNCGLTYVDFSKAKNLSIIEKYAFHRCNFTKTLDLSACENLTIIGAYSFGLNRCDVVYLPKKRYLQVQCEGAFSKADGGNTAVQYGKNGEFEQVRLF